MKLFTELAVDFIKGKKKRRSLASLKLYLIITLLSAIGFNNLIAQNCNYIVNLELREYIGGKTTFIWSVMNPNPGNGSHGTIKDLDHWGFALNDCINPKDIICKAFSLSGHRFSIFAPEIKVDKSQYCETDPVIKFDEGTSGRVKTYYMVLLNGNYPSSYTSAYFKSGQKKGCCEKIILGIGCKVICPKIQTITGSTICTGTGQVVLNSTQPGVSYQLISGGTVIATQSGATGGGQISFTGLSAGTYTVIAVDKTGKCRITLGTVSVVLNPSPLAFTLTGGTICEAGAVSPSIVSVPIQMSGSEAGVSYQLRRDGADVGAAIIGTGAAINFLNQFSAGTYTVRATNANGCSILFGEAIINARPTPRPVVTVDDRVICVGQITFIRVSIPGGRFPFGFGDIGYTGGTTALAGGVFPGGTSSYYEVTVGGCTGSGDGGSILFTDGPQTFSLTGGSFCEGGPGVPIVMSGSETGVSYQLRRNLVNVGTPIPGTGAAISFPDQTVAGTYSIMATGGGCVRSSTFGAATVTAISCPAGSPTNVVTDRIIEKGDKLNAISYPNPSMHSFTIQTKGAGGKTLQVKIMDILGRIIEVRNDIPVNSKFEIGSNYSPGIYLIEIIQGKERVIMKLVKNSN